jgi:hypothetical protein
MIERTYHVDGTLPENGEVFVFGSNYAGRHGKGAALVARNHFGAVYGCGEGHYNQSYAIPTKDEELYELPLDEIIEGIDEFVVYTHQHPEIKWFVTGVGTGLAHFHAEQIAPHFRNAINCSFPQGWRYIFEQIKQRNSDDHHV